MRALTLSEDAGLTDDRDEKQPQQNSAGSTNGYLFPEYPNPHHHPMDNNAVPNSIPPFHQADSSFPRFSSNLNPRGIAEATSALMQPSTAEAEKKYQPLSNENLFDPSRPRYPSPVHFPHLAKLFFDTLACHFPFLDRAKVMQQVEEGSLSAVLANCLAGLAIRYDFAGPKNGCC